MQDRVQICFINCDLLGKLPELILVTLTVVVTVYSFFYVRAIFKKVDEVEDNIFILKDWIDNLIYIVLSQRGSISQTVLDGIVEHERKPLEAELEYLKMKRQYLLDRVPLLGALKK